MGSATIEQTSLATESRWRCWRRPALRSFDRGRRHSPQDVRRGPTAAV